MAVQIKHKIWLEIDDTMLMGKGHVLLLKAIQKKGSLSGAAKEVGISYRKAWNLIDKLNTHAPSAVVELTKGGAGGGGTLVTEYGKELVTFFGKAEKQSDLVLQKQLGKNEQLWK